MTPATLRQAGEALHGARWQMPLARDLPVDSRLMRRWGAGERPIPAWVAPRLAQMLAEQGKAVTAAHEAVAAHCPDTGRA